MYQLKKPVEAYQCGMYSLDLVPEYFPKLSMLGVSTEVPDMWCIKIGNHFHWYGNKEFLNIFEWVSEGDAYTAYQDSKVAEAKSEFNDGNGY